MRKYLMLSIIYKKVVNTRFYLILANILLVFFLILLNNLGVLPIESIGNFLFFTALALIFALYRPGWAFLFFVGTIALENIIVTPPEFPIQLRPYQIIGALTILAVIIRFILKRLNFKLIKLNFADYLLIFFAIASYISTLFAINRGVSFKQSLVLTSFVALYFLVRLFVQNIDDLKKVFPFLSSSVIIVLYGIWQNWRFMHGSNSFEVMQGRPNGTFTEPDWLGIFLVLLLTILYSLIYKISNDEFLISNQIPNPKSQKSKIYLVSCWLLVVGCLVLLILTVSRSAWLGAAVVTIIFLAITLLKYRDWKRFFQQFVFIAIAIFTSIGLVYLFNLTNFQLFNRIQSTETGLQKITISCNLEVQPPNVINSVEELDKYGCRHINLEDIEKEKSAGFIVKEIYRKDPNVVARSEIYRKSLEQIKEHPIFGIGWGNIGTVLGKDERGVGLNSSNIFLEIWLGTGILGIASFVLIWSYIILSAGKFFISSPDDSQEAVFLFIILSWFAFTVTNLFNAGIFLGILWLYLAIPPLFIKKKAV